MRPLSNSLLQCPEVVLVEAVGQGRGPGPDGRHSSPQVPAGPHGLGGRGASRPDHPHRRRADPCPSRPDEQPQPLRPASIQPLPHLPTSRSWVSLGPASRDGDVALCSAGADVLLFSVSSNRRTLYVRASADRGATFGQAVYVTTASSPITWLAADLKPDGTALLLYALGQRWPLRYPAFERQLGLYSALVQLPLQNPWGCRPLQRGLERGRGGPGLDGQEKRGVEHGLRRWRGPDP